MTDLLSRIRQRARPSTATPAAAPAPAEPRDALSSLFGGRTPAAPSPAPAAAPARPTPIIQRRASTTPHGSIAGGASNYVTGLVALADEAPEVQRIGGAGHLHASSLIGICERLHVIAAEMPEAIIKPVTGSDRLVWAIGRAVEKHIRTQFIKARNFEGIYGRWTCDNATCAERNAPGFTGVHGLRKACACGRPYDTYNEPSLWDDDNGFVGNPDLTFLLDGLFVVTEIKSMEKEAFQDLESPLADHVHQAILYRDLYRRLGYPVADFVIIVYVSKGYSFRRKDKQGRSTIYKEFRVDATQPHFVRLVSDSIASARLVKDARENGRLPPRCPACTSIDTSTAKNCPLVGRCFNMD